MTLLRKGKREVMIATFVLVALYLSLMEVFIPKPLPFLKIGLSNIVTLIVMEKYDTKMALEVLLLRVSIQGLLLGTLLTPSFLISLLGGLGSLGILTLLYKKRERFSLVAISLLCGGVHNIIQLLVVKAVLFRNIEIYSRSTILFIATFTTFGLISGGIIGVIAEKLNLRRRIR